MREPNFITPNRSPAFTTSPSFTRQTMRRARMPTICRTTMVCPPMIDRDLGELVQVAGFRAVRRQEAAGMILHLGHPAARPACG